MQGSYFKPAVLLEARASPGLKSPLAHAHGSDTFCSAAVELAELALLRLELARGQWRGQQAGRPKAVAPLRCATALQGKAHGEKKRSPWLPCLDSGGIDWR
jgi:hypothetical protein